MRLEKKAIVEEIRVQVKNSSFVILTDYHGLNVDLFTELRRQLRSVGADVHVVKNRLFKQISMERGWSQIEGDLRGPTAMVVGGEVASTAKILKKFTTDNKLPRVKAGMLGDVYLSAAGLSELAALPTREGLYGMLVGTLASPLTRLVSVFGQKVASVVYVLKAIETKRSNNGGLG